MATKNNLTISTYNMHGFKNGVGFLWRKELSSRVKILKADIAGRCLALRLNISSIKSLVMIVVYFPCYSNTNEYWNDLGFCLGFIVSILSSNTDEVIIFGDFNFPCMLSNAAFVRCMDTLKEYSVCECDEYITGDKTYTYVNDPLGHKSLIDHIFMSKSLMVHILIRCMLWTTPATYQTTFLWFVNYR